MEMEATETTLWRVVARTPDADALSVDLCAQPLRERELCVTSTRRGDVVDTVSATRANEEPHLVRMMLPVTLADSFQFGDCFKLVVQYTTRGAATAALPAAAAPSQGTTFFDWQRVPLKLNGVLLSSSHAESGTAKPEDGERHHTFSVGGMPLRIPGWAVPPDLRSAASNHGRVCCSMFLFPGRLRGAV